MNMWKTILRTSGFSHFETVFLCILFSVNAFAQIPNPAKNINDIQKRLPQNAFLRVKSARVAYADYDLIAKDFPSMQKGSTESLEQWHSRVDGWLLEHSAVMRIDHITSFATMTFNGFVKKLAEQAKSKMSSRELYLDYIKIHNKEINLMLQAEGTATNTFIDADFEKPVKAYVPFNYNRAHVSAASGGLLDVKGTGTDNPIRQIKQNGLLPLWEAIREVIMQKTIDMILRREDIPNRTVGNYAVIDFGFNIIYPDGNQEPAGAVVRQAARRNEYNISMVPVKTQETVERALRKYGITATGDSLPKFLKPFAEKLQKAPPPHPSCDGLFKG